MPPPAKRRREDDYTGLENVDSPSSTNLSSINAPGIGHSGLNGLVYGPPGMSLPAMSSWGSNTRSMNLPSIGTLGRPDAPMPLFQNRLPIPAGLIVPSVDNMLDSLDPAQIRSILATTISEDPLNCALSNLTDFWIQKVMNEQARTIDFDHHSKSVWRTLNVTYNKLSGSKQYDFSFDAFDSVIGEIEEIDRQVTRVSSYGTRLSALETLRKIGKSILLSGNDCLGSEVRKQFGHDTRYADTMWNIVEGMTEEERLMASQHVSEAGKGTLAEKINWVVQEAKGYCMFDQLDEVLDLLNGVGEEEDEDEEQEDDDAQGAVNHSTITIDSD